MTNYPRLADIGEEEEEVTFEPLPEEAPAPPVEVPEAVPA